MNPIYNSFFNQNMNSNNPQNFMQQFNQFRQNFSGDPRQKIQEMLNSGKVSPQQYQNAMQMANRFKSLFGM
jgi:hypothetical protein